MLSREYTAILFSINRSAISQLAPGIGDRWGATFVGTRARCAAANKRQMGEIPGLTVVLADHHAVVREGLAALCVENGMIVVGQACDGLSALETIAKGAVRDRNGKTAAPGNAGHAGEFV